MIPFYDVSNDTCIVRIDANQWGGRNPGFSNKRVMDPKEGFKNRSGKEKIDLKSRAGKSSAHVWLNRP